MRLLLLIFLATTLHGQELLENGNFRRGVESWRFNCNKYKGVFPKVTRMDRKSVVYVQVPQAGASHDVLLAQDVAVENAGYYRLSVDLRMQAEGQVRLMVKQRSKPWKANGLYCAVKPTEKWQRFIAQFQAVDIDPDNPPVLRIDLGELKGSVMIRDCSLIALEEAVDVGKWGGKVVSPEPQK
ncbi:MAG: extradiol dioxygenase family protein [Rhodothermales bacterium]|jgi:extradiol dioxygenase family protein